MKKIETRIALYRQAGNFYLVVMVMMVALHFVLWATRGMHDMWTETAFGVWTACCACGLWWHGRARGLKEAHQNGYELG